MTLPHSATPMANELVCSLTLAISFHLSAQVRTRASYGETAVGPSPTTAAPVVNAELAGLMKKAEGPWGAMSIAEKAARKFRSALSVH